MRFTLCQTVKIVDMNDEIIHEVLFEHGEVELPVPSIGASVINHPLGLRQFEVVYDKRAGQTKRSKIIDIEIDLLGDGTTVRVFLEPVTLIVGQHDVGMFE
ncbi:hypothetical protein [Paenibacillus contaminans]|uniref:Uncharacterized protein n=1 Tax=Paenibacillus contaminans TaxID=450362 RepID=A0A329MRW2_9BACL|nr:hypothetical protein [Paenibacillus contaminans]RAV22292.1 hypothetical protein DQG23_04900 [Paenibacillus contaminans]